MSSKDLPSSSSSRPSVSASVISAVVSLSHDVLVFFSCHSWVVLVTSWSLIFFPHPSCWSHRSCSLTRYRLPRIINEVRIVTPPDEELYAILPSPFVQHQQRERKQICACSINGKHGEGWHPWGTPDLMYYPSRLSKVMSRPTLAHMGPYRKVLQYLHVTYDNVITYGQLDVMVSKTGVRFLLSFSDWHWSWAIDTRRFHGSHVLMPAGGSYPGEVGLTSPWC